MKDIFVKIDTWIFEINGFVKIDTLISHKSYGLSKLFYVYLALCQTNQAKISKISKFVKLKLLL